MFNFILLFLFLFTNAIANNYKSIHQQQLEFFNKNYTSPQNNFDWEPIKKIKRRNRDTSHEVFGYHPYWMGTSWQNYNFNLISTLAYFSAEATSTGELENLHGWPVSGLINMAHEHGTEVVLCVTLFNTNDLVTLLSNPSYRENLINNLVSQVQAGNADGVNVDFESFPASQKENMVTFITNLTNTFHSELPGSQVTLAMPAVDWNDAWDYNSLATISDGLFIMGYAYHWSGSPTTGPNSPLSGSGYTITSTVFDYLNKTNYQSDKLILGCPYYGFLWPSESNTAGAATTGTGQAQFFSQMEGNALSFGKLWHQNSQTPWYTYDNNGWYQGWYDDSLSLSLKYDFAIENSLKGIGIWAMGYDGDNTQLWNLLHSKFGDETPPTIPNKISMKNIGDGIIKINFSGGNNATEFIILREYLEQPGVLDTLGIYYQKPIIIDDLNAGESYFLSIIASNIFGESEKTETLGIIPTSEVVTHLVINGFDRVTGTNNTFNFIMQHGASILNQGYAFDSATNEAVTNDNINIMAYQFLDWILGEEGSSTSTFTSLEQDKIKLFLEDGRFLFVSGSEIGYDLIAQGNAIDQQFYSNYLKAEYISDAAGGHQGVYSGYGENNSSLNDIINITFDNGTQGTYNVDWPDGIKPLNGAVTCAKYSTINYNDRGGMGIEYTGPFGSSNKTGGLVYLAVGFESIYPETKRNEIMSRVSNFYETQLAIGENSFPLSPSTIRIQKIYPNPTNTSATIFLSIPEFENKTTFTVQDILGRTMTSKKIELAGNNQVLIWDGLNNYGQELPSGVYILSLRNGYYTDSRRVTLLK